MMKTLAALTLLLAAIGCGQAPQLLALADDDPLTASTDDVADAPLRALEAWDTSLRFSAVSDGRVRGTIGATTFDAAPDIATVYDDGAYAALSVYALAASGRRVMLQLGADADVSTPAATRTALAPGTGSRFRPHSRVHGLACQGNDSGDASAPFSSTDYDEAPCEVAIDTEQDLNDPQALRVHVAATLPLGGGGCRAPDDEGATCLGMANSVGQGCAEVALTDLDGDGDGDLDDSQPWDAQATFLLLRE